MRVISISVCHRPFNALEAGAVSLEGDTTTLASHYASLVDRWFNYVESL